MHLPCPACGYNLVGVPHEPGKDARLRCPECGGATSLQEIHQPARAGVFEHLLVSLCCTFGLGAYLLLARTMYREYWRYVGEPFPWYMLLWIAPCVIVAALPWVFVLTSLQKAVPKPLRWTLYTLYSLGGSALTGLVLIHGLIY